MDFTGGRSTGSPRKSWMQKASRDVRIVPHHNKLFDSGDDPFDRSMLAFALGPGEGVREMHLARMAVGLLIVGAIECGATASARAQPAASGPPAVGVVEAIKRPITETDEFLGRIEAVNRVNVVARVTAFLEKRLFEEGNEIKAGDKLYLLERGPFEADLASKQAVFEQVAAAHRDPQFAPHR